MNMSNMNGGRRKAASPPNPGFKPGVRYFVLPNYHELDPPAAAREPTGTARVRELLGREQLSHHELCHRLALEGSVVNSALYRLVQGGEVVVVDTRPVPKDRLGHGTERVYALARS